MDPVGLGAVAAVMVVGVVVGVWRRRSDGRLRDVAPAAVPVPAPAEDGPSGDRGIAPVVRRAELSARDDFPGRPASEEVGVGMKDGVGSLRQRRGLLVAADAREEPGVIGAEGDAGAAVRPDAREEPGVIEAAGDPSAAGERLDAGLMRELGVGEAKATLLQFSSAFCAPCRAVRRVSSEVAAMVPGVQHVEVDAESHLEAVRALGIWRTPTLLVLDGDGRVVKRATGVPGKPQLIAALGDVL